MNLTPPLYKTGLGSIHSVAELLQKMSQPFGANPANYGGHGHEGIDWGCVVGTNVYAMHDGTATKVLNGYTAYGTYMQVQGSGVRTYYCHLSQVVKEGPVKSGDLIGKSGNTGNSTGPHLHVTVKLTNAQGVIIPSLPGFDGAVDFSAMLVWRPVYNEVMTAKEVRKLQALEGFHDQAGIDYWTGKSLEDYLNARLPDKKKEIEDSLK